MGNFSGSRMLAQESPINSENDAPAMLFFYDPALHQHFLDRDVARSLSRFKPPPKIYSFSSQHGLDQIAVPICPPNWEETATSMFFRNVYIIKTPIIDTNTWDSEKLLEFIEYAQIKVVVDTTVESRYNKMELLTCGLEKVYNLPLQETPADCREQAEMVLQVAASIGIEKGAIAVIGYTHEEWALFTAARIARLNCEEFEEFHDLQEAELTTGITNTVLRGLLNKARI